MESLQTVPHLRHHTVIRKAFKKRLPFFLAFYRRKLQWYADFGEWAKYPPKSIKKNTAEYRKILAALELLDKHI